MSKQRVLLGAHMSIAGGIENAYTSGASIGCTAVQFFTHSNRQWSMKKLSPEAVTLVKTAQKETGITHAMVHASYLINLASASADTRKKSKHMLTMELDHCAALGISHLILHPGSHPDKQEGIKLLSEGLNEVLETTPSTTHIALETMAGQGSQLGTRFEDLASIKEGVTHKKSIAFCVDTCHVWAAGYDFSHEKGYEKMWNEFDSILGIEHLKALHLNDSKKGCNSRVDRHDDIGKGTIGLEAFKLIMKDGRFATIPKVLETPGKELSEYAHNMKVLLEL
jgi:deoxyribonuclease IV